MAMAIAQRDCANMKYRWKPDFIDNGDELESDWKLLLGYNEPGV